VRHRKKSHSRSSIVLDIAKLYYGGLTIDFDRHIDVGSPSEVEIEIGMCERVLESNPHHYDALALLGDAYTRNGEYQKGLELDLRLAELKPDNGVVAYNLACSYALTGQADNALCNLSKAVELGYNDVEQLCMDNDLALLKSDPRFQTLVQKLVDKVEKAPRKK
jgi:tetratricopeptide (TPR) repeat protein